jgi:hypothetical protein
MVHHRHQVLHAQLVVEGHVDVLDLRHIEQSLLTGQDTFEEVFCDENVRREIKLDWQ